MKLELHQIAFWAGADLRPRETASEIIASGHSIDSRTLKPGDLFIAIKGERFDGHDFLTAAFEHGAAAAMVAHDKLTALPEEACKHPLLVVQDTLAALQQLATAVRKHWGHQVVAVTGSAGKTTTKEAIAKVLSSRFSVLKSQGNLNNGYGLPLQLLKLEPEHEIAVIEMGMSSAGEIAALAAIATPDWGVVTNVGNAHAEFFPDGIAGIARAKYELIEALPEHGVAFLNCDDAYVSQFGRDFHGKAVYFGRGPCADPKAERIESLEADGQLIAVRAGGERVNLHLHLLGEHNVSNALAAVAVGIEAGIPVARCCEALADLRPEDKRGQILTVRGATIINDSYNSNPEALKAMIATLASMPAEKGGRRIMVAGEMLELGAESAALHAACGKSAADAGINIVVGVRGHASHIVEAAKKEGSNKTLFLESPEEAGQWLREILRPGDVVLLKASRGVKLERALDVLTQ
ncbi:MAG: UDP-N-acetylmuramoyl-tripeptide--D-alanyl-D-alanine ligase [Acidobacteriaceae bacterium]|nr:UDP-N-acetylmuramoyl-tripeptide--D-alanyl-D-alanine ligase [Acidobacteriaceae bacterium]